MATASQAAATKGPSDAQETAEHQKMQGQRDYCIYSKICENLYLIVTWFKIILWKRDASGMQ